MATVLKESSPTTPRASLGARLFRSRETGIVIALVIMVAVLSIAAPEFRTTDNLLNNARNFSYVGIVTIGQAMVMITGGIDLSVGSVWGVSAVTTAALMAGGWPTIFACAGGLGVAALFGLFNGLCVTKLRMPPFVPTLATMAIGRALALVITRGHSINDFRPFGDPFYELGGGDTFGLPNPFIIISGAHRRRLDRADPHRIWAPALRDRRQ
jgi:ribose transport system permease protein